MQDFVHRKNLEHYRRLLGEGTLDAAGLAYVRTLLADEEAKDRLLSSDPQKDE